MSWRGCFRTETWSRSRRALLPSLDIGNWVARDSDKAGPYWVAEDFGMAGPWWVEEGFDKVGPCCLVVA